MNKEESRLRFAIATAIRDFAYFRDELVRLRDRFAYMERLEREFNRLIEELGGSIELYKRPCS